MAFREPPPKAHCFTFNAPTGSSADEIIDAIEETVGPGGLETLQHQGGVKFIAAVASAAAAVKLSSRGSFVLNGASVPVAQVGPRVLYISAFRVPPYVGDATLAAALSTYGKVLAIQESQFKGRPTVGTGVRVIRMEMAKPVPNFLSVQGHRIMFDYRGIRKVCSRCGAEGHLGKTCETPRCERCEVYGHETAKCTSPCRRCSGNHVTADCFLPRSYAAAAAGANIPASIEDNDGQPDQDEVQTPLEGPRHSELSETASRSESSDSSEDDFPPLPSTERSTTEVSASETDSSKTTSPSEHETDAADSATRESVAVNEPTDEPRPSVDRRLHPQPEQTPSPGIGRETGLAQARGYQVPRTTDASLMNPVVTFEESVYLSDDEVRSELRKQGYGEVPYSVLQQFKCDFQRRIREEIRKGVNTSTPLERAKGSTSSTKQTRFDSSSLLENVTYSSCYSSPYYESQRIDSSCKSGDDVATAKPPRKVVPAPRNHVKPEASSSCYSTPAGSSCEQSTDSSKGSDLSGNGLAPRLLHRKVLRCCNGHAYISERSTLSTDSQELTGSVLESFKENYSNLEDTLPKRQKPATLPPLKGEPIQKDLIKPQKGTMLSLLKVSGTKVTWNRGPHKCDPVTRYHEYKAFWERHKAPGEKAHKQLRWNVRAQMLQRDDVVACSWRPAITKEPPATRPK